MHHAFQVAIIHVMLASARNTDPIGAQAQVATVVSCTAVRARHVIVDTTPLLIIETAADHHRACPLRRVRNLPDEVVRYGDNAMTDSFSEIIK